MEQTKGTKTKNNLFIDNLTRLKRDAYAKLDQALNLDQSNESNDTKVILYESSLILINKALAYNKENQTSLNENEDAIKIVKQLNEMKKLTNERLEHLNKENSTKLDEEFLNISDDCLLVNEDDEDSDVILIDSPHKTTKNDSNLLKDFEKANEIYRLENGVQQFFIAPDGTVSTPSHLTDINIYTFENGLNQNNGKNIVGFVKVDNWMYPLVPNESPAMKTNFNAFIFPNTNQQDPNVSFIGITFDKNVKNDNLMFFEDVLASYSSLIYQDSTPNEGIKRPLVNSATSEALQSNLKKSEKEIPNQPKSKSNEQLNKDDNQTPRMKSSLTAENIAKHLLTGAEYISKGVSSTSEYANKYLQIGGEKLVSNTVPNPEPAKIDPKLKTAVSTVRYGSHLTVRVSNFLVQQLKTICSSTGKALAPHIRDGSKYLLNQTGMQSDKSSSYIDSTCKVASSAIEGFSIVYDSLEGAAKQLGKSFTEQSVTVVNHKYGADAAKVTENSLYSVGNVAQSVNNFQNLKIIRTLAKTTAKETLIANQKKNDTKSELSTQSEKK